MCGRHSQFYLVGDSSGAACLCYSCSNSLFVCFSSDEIGNFAYRGNLIPPYKSSLKVRQSLFSLCSLSAHSLTCDDSDACGWNFIQPVSLSLLQAV